MAKRWAIARMGDYENDGSLVPKFNMYPCNSRIWTQPGRAWCFGHIACFDITPLQADPDIYVLPEGVMSMSIQSIPQAERQNMTTRLQAAGFETSEIKLQWTLKQALQYLRDQLQATAGDIEQGDVVDIES